MLGRAGEAAGGAGAAVDVAIGADCPSSDAGVASGAAFLERFAEGAVEDALDELAPV